MEHEVTLASQLTDDLLLVLERFREHEVTLASQLTDDLLLVLERFSKVRPQIAFHAMLRDNERIRKVWVESGKIGLRKAEG